MGEVYRGRDLKLKRTVAIKILPPHFAEDPDRRQRFQQEAEALASLNHPNIAAIHTLEEAGGTRFLVLEFVEGETLDERRATDRCRRTRGSRSRSRCAAHWRPRTTAASCIATSSPQTSRSRQTAR
jgi:serine/threonine protein kinase